MQPRLSAFYSYSTRIAYSDRLIGTGEFQNVPIGFVENTNQRVLTPVQSKLGSLVRNRSVSNLTTMQDKILD